MHGVLTELSLCFMDYYPLLPLSSYLCEDEETSNHNNTTVNDDDDGDYNSSPSPSNRSSSSSSSSTHCQQQRQNQQQKQQQQQQQQQKERMVETNVVVVVSDCNRLPTCLFLHIASYIASSPSDLVPLQLTCSAWRDRLSLTACSSFVSKTTNDDDHRQQQQNHQEEEKEEEDDLLQKKSCNNNHENSIPCNNSGIKTELQEDEQSKLYFWITLCRARYPIVPCCCGSGTRITTTTMTTISDASFRSVQQLWLDEWKRRHRLDETVKRHLTLMIEALVVTNNSNSNNSKQNSFTPFFQPGGGDSSSSSTSRRYYRRRRRRVVVSQEKRVSLVYPLWYEIMQVGNQFAMDACRRHRLAHVAEYSSWLLLWTMTTTKRQHYHQQQQEDEERLEQQQRLGHHLWTSIVVATSVQHLLQVQRVCQALAQLVIDATTTTANTTLTRNTPHLPHLSYSALDNNSNNDDHETLHGFYNNQHLEEFVLLVNEAFQVDNSSSATATTEAAAAMKDFCNNNKTNYDCKGSHYSSSSATSIYNIRQRTIQWLDEAAQRIRKKVAREIMKEPRNKEEHETWILLKALIHELGNHSLAIGCHLSDLGRREQQRRRHGQSRRRRRQEGRQRDVGTESRGVATGGNRRHNCVFAEQFFLDHYIPPIQPLLSCSTVALDYASPPSENMITSSRPPAHSLLRATLAVCLGRRIGLHLVVVEQEVGDEEEEEETTEEVRNLGEDPFHEDANSYDDEDAADCKFSVRLLPPPIGREVCDANSLEARKKRAHETHKSVVLVMDRLLDHLTFCEWSRRTAATTTPNRHSLQNGQFHPHTNVSATVSQQASLSLLSIAPAFSVPVQRAIVQTLTWTWLDPRNLDDHHLNGLLYTWAWDLVATSNIDDDCEQCHHHVLSNHQYQENINNNDDVSSSFALEDNETSPFYFY